MKQAGKNILRVVVIVMFSMTALINVEAAQLADDETITVEVRYECVSDIAMGVEASATDGPDHPIIVPAGDTESNNPSVNFRLTVQNALCNQWVITAQLSDFVLSTDASKTFPASTFVLTNSGASPNPDRWTSQPDWVDALPDDLPIGAPTMPASVTFVEYVYGNTANGDVPLMSSSTADYGSPGMSTAYYNMKLVGVPADLPWGKYTANLTVSMQGAS